MYMRESKSSSIKESEKILNSIYGKGRKLYVKDIMSKDLITLHIDSKLSVADELVHQRAINHVPIVDDDDKLIGLITSKDIIRETCQTQTHRTNCVREELKDKISVGEIMRGGLITIKDGTLITKAAKIMVEENVGCLPVVSNNGLLLGILTEKDFVSLVSRGIN